MHAVFRESVHFPNPHYCLRMRLKPLTIGHKFLLNDIRSPFVTVADSVTRANLWTAVMLCSQPYPKALKSFNPSLVDSFLTSLFLILWGRLCRGMDLASETERFVQYLSDHQAFPPTKQPEDKELRSLKAPAEWRLALMMQEDFGLTWEQALNTPMLRANAIWATKGDREGWIDLKQSNNPVVEARAEEFWKWAAEEDRKLAKN